jgi:cytochrome c biogenesis protein CcmG/thiol:disulfide interchange protein DsbE
VTRLAAGVSRLTIDSETGMLVRSDNEEVIEQSLDDGPGRSPHAYKVNWTYSLTRMTYGVVLDTALFKLPETGMREVKEFTKWDAARIRKELAGKPAPELEVTDIKGNPVSLANLKGKTVLLDFWTSWCPPCLADAPSLDKLYARYGSTNLMIIGISVNEERDIVERFLQKKPHVFPVVLTSENEMQHPYQVGKFPTYMVIAPDGTLNAAFEGDQGFGELRRHLEKAGMPTE